MKQVTLEALQEATARAAWQGSSTRTLADLQPGDLVEVRQGDRVVRGWVSAYRHPATGEPEWQADGGRDWRTYGPHDYLSSGRWSVLGSWMTWRWIDHDPDWVHTPTPTDIAAWLPTLADQLRDDDLHVAYHIARNLLPYGYPRSIPDPISVAFTALAIGRLPVADFLRQSRKASNSGSRIWCCPPAVQARIAAEVWPLNGEDRFAALRSLEWEEPWAHGILRRRFAAHAVSIYDGYWRWAMGQAASLRQLMEICDEWQTESEPKEEAQP